MKNAVTLRPLSLRSLTGNTCSQNHLKQRAVSADDSFWAIWQVFFARTGVTGRRRGVGVTGRRGGVGGVAGRRGGVGGAGRWGVLAAGEMERRRSAAHKLPKLQRYKAE